MVASGFSSSGPGQSSSSDSESSSAESRQFDDGLDDQLMGGEEDRRKLDQMTEAEREQEVFNRSSLWLYCMSVIHCLLIVGDYIGLYLFSHHKDILCSNKVHPDILIYVIWLY